MWCFCLVRLWFHHKCKRMAAAEMLTLYLCCMLACTGPRGPEVTVGFTLAVAKLLGPFPPCRVTGGLRSKDTTEEVQSQSQHQHCAPWTTQPNEPQHIPPTAPHHSSSSNIPVLLFFVFTFGVKPLAPSCLTMSFPFLYAPTFPPPSVPSLPGLFIRETWETGLKPCLRHSASCHTHPHTHTHMHESPLNDLTIQHESEGPVQWTFLYRDVALSQTTHFLQWNFQLDFVLV